jgi:hypothetical protein
MGSTLADDFLDQALAPARETLDIQRQTQKEEDRWASEKEALAAKFTVLEERKKKLQVLNAEARKAVEDKTQNLASLEKQLEDMEKTSKEIEPFLGVVYERLVRSLQESPPFLAVERKARVENLGLILKDDGMTISEKFRRLAEALMVEVEYGGTVDVYPETIQLSGKEIRVRVLRLGRVSLFCQSLDRKVSGVYDVASGTWQALPKPYNKDMDTAVEIASKRRPAQIVTLPLGRMAVK